MGTGDLDTYEKKAKEEEKKPVEVKIWPDESEADKSLKVRSYVDAFLKFIGREGQMDVEKRVFTDSAHIVLMVLPEDKGKAFDLSRAMLKGHERESSVKPTLRANLSGDKAVKYCYPMHFLLASLNILKAMDDTDVYIKLNKEHGKDGDWPMEIEGRGTGVVFVIAPRIEND